jgi:hypothetical protein
MEKDSMQVVNDEIPDPREIIEVTFDFYPETVANLHTTDIDNSIEPPSQDDHHADIKDNTKQEDIIRFQQECPYYKHIYNFLDEGTLPDDPKRAHAIPYEANQYIMLDGILYHLYQRRMKKKVKEEDTIRQLAVPTKLRHEIQLSYHDSKAGGCHMGIQKTYDSTRQKYFWPGMYQDIHKYITTCKICQVTKRDVHAKKHAMHPLPIQDVFPRWHMDILAGLPKTKEGYQYILLMIDSFSHWCECVPLQSQDAANVAKVLYNEIFTRYGLPSSILSDRGQNFMSKLVSSLCAIFEVTRLRTSSFHPQTNGIICERQNSTLAQCLRAYCHENQDQWSEHLPSVRMAFRMTHGVQTTGYSPYRILFGKEMTLPIDVSLLPQEHITQAPKEIVDAVLKKIKITREIARENLQRAQESMKEKHDQSAHDSTLNIIQCVLLKQEHIAPGRKKKLEVKWVGPYYIVRRAHNDTYIIRNCETHKEHKSPVNASRLKPYNDPRDARPLPNEHINQPVIQTDHLADKDPQDQGEIQHPQEPDETQDETENEDSDKGCTQNDQNQWFPVENILKTKWVRGKKHYLVRWAGNYPDSWEPGENLSDHLKERVHANLSKKCKRRRKRY